MTFPEILPTPRTPDPREAPPLRWGIIAPGGIARSFAEGLRRHTQQEIYAVGSRRLESADAFAREFGASRAYGSYEALIADPGVEAVYVASPHSHHAEQAALAIQAGKPVLVEKSLTRDAAEARALVESARSARVPLMEAMWTRYLPHIDVVRQLLDDGALGELELVTADHGQHFDFNPEHRLFAPELAGGGLLDLGIYPISFAHFVLGRPGTIAARGTSAPTGVDRQVSAILDGYGDHPNAHALVTTTLAAKSPCTASVSGNRARIELPGPFYVPQQVTLVTRDDEVLTSAAPAITGHEALCFEAAYFASMVAAGRLESDLLPLDESVAIMEVMDAVRAAAFDRQD